MTSLWSVAAVVIILLLRGAWPPAVVAVDTPEDQDLVQEFRNLFSEFLRGSPKKQDRGASKHIRDTSKVDRRRKLAAEAKLVDKPAEEANGDRPRLSPLHSCNFFDAESRLCANVRQVGTTLTIGVRVEGADHKVPPVHWYRVFVVRERGDQEEQFTFVQFTRDGLPWNINIGGENNELRISPVTEVDFSYNFFLATLDEGRPGKDKVVKQKGHRQLLMFSIEPISIDMGPLYHGEEITMNVRSHVELPPGSVHYEWARVSGSDLAVTRNLPSNMRLNRDASALVVKEHTDYGDDITLTCAVFSNRNVTLARRNFFLRKIVSAKATHQNARKGFPGSTFFRRRRRRFLDEFYAQGRSRTAKREAGDIFLDEAVSSTTPQEEGDNFLTMGEFFGRQESTSLEEKPKETALNLNYYGKQQQQQEQLPSPEFPAFRQQEGVDPWKQTEAPPLDELIPDANGFPDQKDDLPVVRGRVNAYYATTVRIVNEGRPTFEDRESMLIADCYRDSDCGANAVCARIEGSKRFCRCKPHYRGNGLFCWLF